MLLSSCNSNNQEQPPISREKMSTLMLDIHFAEAYSSVIPKDSNAKPASVTGKNIDSLAVYHQAILSKHHIKLSEWQQALKWYIQHPSELDSVYAIILPKLDSLKTTNTSTTDTLKSK